MQNNTFDDDANRTDRPVILLVNTSSSATITGNTITCTGADIPLLIDPDVQATGFGGSVTGNTISCAGTRAIGIQGTTGGASTLDALNGITDYIMTTTVTVANGTSLTLPSGSSLDGNGFNSLTVNGGGTLNTDDTTFSNVVVNYQTNSAGSFLNSSVSYTSSGCPITVTDASPTFDGNTFNNTSSGRLCIGGSSTVSPAAPTLNNNAFTSRTSSGAVDVGGTAQPVITNNSFSVVTSNTVGLRMSNTSAGSVTGNTFTFFPDGGSGRFAMLFENAASPAVSGNTIVDDVANADTGINVFVNPPSTASVTGNTINCSGGDFPFRIDADLLSAVSTATVSGNTVSCAGSGNPVAVQGTVSNDTTLDALDGLSDFQLTSTLTVSSGASLTLPPGATMNGVFNSLTVNGALNADNAELTNVLITHSAGSDGGNFTNSTVTYTSSGCIVTVTDSSPSYSGNTFVMTSSGRFCIGGSSVASPAQPTLTTNSFNSRSSNGAVDVDGTAEPTLLGNSFVVDTNSSVGVRLSVSSGGSVDGNTFTFNPEVGSGRSAIWLEGTASANVVNNTIVDDPNENDFGINLLMNALSTSQVNANTIGCSGADTPLRVDPDVLSVEFQGAIGTDTISCAATNDIGIQSTLSGTATLATLSGIPRYRLTSTLTVAAAADLTVPTGNSLNGVFNSLTINGDLNSEGGEFINVFMDYNAGAGGTVNNADITYTSSSCMIDITDASPTISNSTFTQPSTARVCIGGSSVITPSAPSIAGNTLTSRTSNGAIDVNGTAQPSLTGNTITSITSNTIGVRTSGTSAGLIDGNTFDFFTQAGSGRVAIRIDGESSPTVSNNTINDDFTRNDTGLFLAVDITSTLNVTGNNVDCSGGDIPLQLDPDIFSLAFLGAVSGNTFTCSQNSIALSGTVSGTVELTDLDGLSNFNQVSTITVPASTTMRILPGVSVSSNNQTFNVDGTLEVDQASVSSVRFEIDGNMDADQMVMQNGWLNFKAGSTGLVDNSTITGATNLTGVFITDASPTFTNSTFGNWSKAVDLAGTTNATFTGNTFNGNVTGVEVSTGLSGSTVETGSFISNTQSVFFANADALFSAFPQNFGSNLFTGAAGTNVARLPTSSNAFNNISGTIPAIPVPYYNTADMTIQNGSQVVLEPGTVITNGAFANIFVEDDGRLVANGTTALPIVFTDFTPKTGTRWDGLVIRDPDSDLQNCVVEFSRVDGLRIEGVDLDVTSCRISDNIGDGVETTLDTVVNLTDSAVISNLVDGVKVNATPVTGTNVVQLNSIFSNGGLGINNVPGGFDVAATNNYWGDDSGPLDNSDDRATGGLFNPTGLGQSVSDGVAYDPWIRIGPTIEGAIVPVSGGGQIGVVGTTLPDPFVVRIESTLGTPLPGIEVIFTVVQGDATVLASQPVLTDASGEASTQVQLGLSEGDILLTATARDINSPLASFLAEADNPCLIPLKAEGLSTRILPFRVNQLGDVNGDGYVNPQDAALLAALQAGLIDIDSPLLVNLEGGDINEDGLVDSGDALVIQGVHVGRFD